MNNKYITCVREGTQTECVLLTIPGMFEVLCEGRFVCMDYSYSLPSVSRLMSSAQQIRDGQLSNQERTALPKVAQQYSFGKDNLVMPYDNPNWVSRAVVCGSLWLGGWFQHLSGVYVLGAQMQDPSEFEALFRCGTDGSPDDPDGEFWALLAMIFEDDRTDTGIRSLAPVSEILNLING